MDVKKNALIANPSRAVFKPRSMPAIRRTASRLNAKRLVAWLIVARKSILLFTYWIGSLVRLGVLYS